MDGSDEAEEKIEVVPSTENDAAQDEGGEEGEGESSSVTEEQWTAMKGTLDYLYAYRDEE